ncbi:MAG: SgcJ/EcaC family oxidoreductase [Burkholderiales bacterium]|nr:SgcJ/EcaC family oxidoreductase [Burkholderiales bacterium]
MNILRSLFALMLLLGAHLSFAADDKPAIESPAQAVAAATAEWIAAFNTRDPAKVTALYARDAVLLGTVSPTIRANRAEILEYFTDSATRRPRLQMTLGQQDIRVYGNIAFNSGFYTSTNVQDGQEVVNRMRFSFAYRNDNGRWMIINHHSSRVPAP